MLDAGCSIPHPPTNNHRGTEHTEKAQSHPPTLQRRGAETQRRRGVLDEVLPVARFRPSENGREPLGRESGSKARFRSGFPTQRLALGKRKPRHLSSSVNRWEWFAPSPNNEENKRQNRRASGTAAFEKPGDDGYSYPELPGFSQATGDPIACRSAGIPRSTSLAQQETLCASTPLRGWVDGWALRSLRFKNGRAGGICVICVICGQIGWVGGSVPSVPLWFSWCPPLVSWCLGGSKTIQHS
jgi:hypothetical protein